MVVMLLSFVSPMPTVLRCYDGAGGRRSIRLSEQDQARGKAGKAGRERGWRRRRRRKTRRRRLRLTRSEPKTRAKRQRVGSKLPQRQGDDYAANQREPAECFALPKLQLFLRRHRRRPLAGAITQPLRPTCLCYRLREVSQYRDGLGVVEVHSKLEGRHAVLVSNPRVSLMRQEQLTSSCRPVRCRPMTASHLLPAAVTSLTSAELFCRRRCEHWDQP
mmetsp:Transcript_12205/g.42490  ORF Transcript_12205/g.42490 Transcript_12205/m.42490 type:complete len:218 (+) Transcript_12205:1518-2171(+)